MPSKDDFAYSKKLRKRDTRLRSERTKKDIIFKENKRRKIAIVNVKTEKEHHRDTRF